MPRPQPLYRLTRRAAADLKDIYRYSRRRWGKAQAEQYASQLQQCLTMLAMRPQAGRRREELQPSGLHSFVQGSHVIFYQPQPFSAAPGQRVSEAIAQRQCSDRAIFSGPCPVGCLTMKILSTGTRTWKENMPWSTRLRRGNMVHA
jgi:toxin ParE1/3/4